MCRRPKQTPVAAAMFVRPKSNRLACYTESSSSGRIVKNKNSAVRGGPPFERQYEGKCGRFCEKSAARVDL